MTAAKPARLIQPYMPADAKLVIGAVRISAEMMTVVALFFRKPNHTAVREVQAAKSEIQMLQTADVRHWISGNPREARLPSVRQKRRPKQTVYWKRKRILQ